MAPPQAPLPPYAASEAQSARTLALVGFIFFAIVAALWAIAALVALFLTLASTGFVVFPWIFPFGVFVALTIGVTVWSWMTLKDIEAGRYNEAETPSLVLGILGIFVNLISGILFLLAYSKLTNVRRFSVSPPGAYGPPGYGMPPQAPWARHCIHCGRAVPADAKFCAFCGKELPA